ncbi:MAG TPA: SAM-dependent methyltransferase [Phycisphaerae bacterium]|jgi:23S rRNA (cytidine1920-2'-O)/16S rRNA (cytidine1409-2'-O)-methyltransferase|nr:SAM-dependent methyltransferase [Phycisphaerae bacterium]
MNDDRFVISPPPSDGGGNAKRSFVSRAGQKLEAAMVAFGIEVAGKVCADLGANVGGFTDCLLQHGAAKVYAVDTAYGVLAWTLRKDARVVVRERSNALHVTFPEKIAVAAVDVGWTRQAKILPVVAGLLAEGGEVLTLVKPHYESEEAKLQRGVLEAEQSERVLQEVLRQIGEMECAGRRWQIKGVVRSPIEGQKGNAEFVAWLRTG